LTHPGALEFAVSILGLIDEDDEEPTTPKP